MTPRAKAAPPRRPGRPPAADGAETRARVLATARRLFAASGFEATSNKDIAAAAGVTTGTMYHYFESKAALYLAAYSEAEELVFDRFAAAVDGCPTLVASVGAVLDAAVDLNHAEPALAGFLVAAPVEARRRPALAAIRERQRALSRSFFGGLVASAAARGELRPGADPAAVTAMISAVVTGFARYADLAEPAEHAAAVAAFQQLLRGQVIASAPAAGRGRARR